MPVATTQLVTSSFIIIVPCGTPQFIQVLLESGWAYVTHHSVPFRHNARVFDALEVRGGAIVMGMVDTEAPPTVLPQGTVPFGMIRFFVAALEAIREGGALSFPFALVFWYGVQFEAIFSFDVAPLIFGWSLCCMNTWDE